MKVGKKELTIIPRWITVSVLLIGAKKFLEMEMSSYLILREEVQGGRPHFQRLISVTN